MTNQPSSIPESWKEVDNILYSFIDPGKRDKQSHYTMYMEGLNNKNNTDRYTLTETANTQNYQIAMKL